MKKDKNWLKAQIKDEEVELKYAFDNYVPYEKVLIADDVNDLLNQLEEPEQEKVVIPQFVADYIEIAKQDISLIRVFDIANNHEELDKWKKEYEWIRGNHEKFAKAWFGYTVEREKLYRVKLLPINRGYLAQWDGTSLQIEDADTGERYENCKTIFTEQEIKTFDERFWTFAEEITK